MLLALSNWTLEQRQERWKISRMAIHGEIRVGGTAVQV
jgi:hypothetical protein